ncbi:unnamed protein product [Soboliphyme baturini]|uniref:OSCP1 n=1 Tax=Soboliphyme baturini TaxID=241478 RepID=A0A183I9N8_9BILA|nr:unnamed protein product [Soboliphyme baturini]
MQFPFGYLATKPNSELIDNITQSVGPSELVEMSLKTLPLLYLNMGGEMCYILDQRLKAQNVKPERSRRVMNDIISTLFNSNFLRKLFEPQEMHSCNGLRLLFDRVAHSSIMRLSPSSTDKLFDLMTMMVKYQIQCSASPYYTLLVTMNHLDGMRRLVQNSPKIQMQIDNAYDLLTINYFSMNFSELMLLRQTMLNFFQEFRVKISVLLKEGQQRQDGRFVIPLNTEIPYGVSKPGIIKYFGKAKQTKRSSFEAGATYLERRSEGNIERIVKNGDRGTELGKNVYSQDESGHGTDVFSFQRMRKRESLAKEELTLLEYLVDSGDRFVLQQLSSLEATKTNMYCH